MVLLAMVWPQNNNQGGRGIQGVAPLLERPAYKYDRWV